MFSIYRKKLRCAHSARLTFIFLHFYIARFGWAQVKSAHFSIAGFGWAHFLEKDLIL